MCVIELDAHLLTPLVWPLMRPRLSLDSCLVPFVFSSYTADASATTTTGLSTTTGLLNNNSPDGTGLSDPPAIREPGVGVPAAGLVLLRGHHRRLQEEPQDFTPEGKYVFHACLCKSNAKQPQDGVFVR